MKTYLRDLDIVEMSPFMRLFLEDEERKEIQDHILAMTFGILEMSDWYIIRDYDFSFYENLFSKFE